MHRTLALRRSLVLVAAFVVITAMPGVTHAQAKAGAAPLKSGEASGSFTAQNGKVYALANAAAFVDQKDASKPVVLLLTDAPVPADVLSGAASLGMSQNMSAHPFTGLVFWLDKDRKIFRQEVWESPIRRPRAGCSRSRSTDPRAGGAQNKNPPRPRPRIHAEGGGSQLQGHGDLAGPGARPGGGGGWGGGAPKPPDLGALPPAVGPVKGAPGSGSPHRYAVFFFASSRYTAAATPKPTNHA